MPALVSGLRVAAPLAPLGAVIGEWVGASAGLGFVMVQANARMQTDTVFAAMAVLAALALALRAAVDGLAPRLAPWADEK
jgi:putative hydroxymethylpyrimidine transport system permease protein